MTSELPDRYGTSKHRAVSNRRTVFCNFFLLGFAFAFLAQVPPSNAQSSRTHRWHASSNSQRLRQAPLPLEDMAHMSWVRRDGAPSDITALAQTKDGYLWTGSRLGLYRFDGIQFSSGAAHTRAVNNATPSHIPRFMRKYPLLIGVGRAEKDSGQNLQRSSGKYRIWQQLN